MLQAELREDTAPQFYACLEACTAFWADPSTAAGIAAQPALARLTACFAAHSHCFDGLGDLQQAVEAWSTCWRVCGELRTDDSYAFAKALHYITTNFLLASRQIIQATTESPCNLVASCLYKKSL
jgi:hypothetical protein